MEQPNAYGVNLKAQEVYNKERLKSGEKFAQGALDAQKSFTEEELKTDTMFKKASEVVAMHLGEPQEGTDEEIAKYGMQLVSDLTIATTTYGGKGMLGLYKKFEKAHPEAKQALYYMIDAVDKKDMTGQGFIRGVKSIGKDPLTLTGVAGAYSFFGKKAGQSIAKKKMMEMLFTSGVSGAYTATDEYLRQELKGKGYDYEAIAEQAGLGAGMGATLGAGLPLVAKTMGWTGQQALKKIDNVMQGRDTVDKGILDQIVTMGKAK